jgi:uncharacterized RDD family membrane protein YckC
MTDIPESYASGAGQEAVQQPPVPPYSAPPPAPSYDDPPPAPSYSPPQAQSFPPPPQADMESAPGIPAAPPIPAGYGYGQYADDAVPQGMYLDQQSGLVLPEGVQLASTGRRIGAFFLAIPLWIVTLGIGYVIWGLIIWGRGQTPALQVLGMRCWRPETKRVAGWWWMALREIVGYIVESVLGIITQLLSFILMMTGRERKSLHDMIAGTVVLRDPNKVLSK